jgi:hypothetical protein
MAGKTIRAELAAVFPSIALIWAVSAGCSSPDMISDTSTASGATSPAGAATSSGSTGSTGSVEPVEPTQPAAIGAWVRNARVAGAIVKKGMTQAEIEQLMSTMLAQNVSVIEADFEEGLSKYMTEADFDQFLEPMQRLASAAHRRGLKIVLYYASLEVLTPNGVTLAHTMAKDHPDWVQVALGGIPNVAYGGMLSTPWVEPGMEDAWMSPNSPYKDMYYNRAAKIAATGLDGIWVDVPLCAAWGTARWNDVSAFASAKFRADTGFLPPAKEDWNDPAWRRWISWRHLQLRDFIAGVAKATRPTPQSEFTVIVETLPTDYTGSTIWGLDGGELHSIDGVISVYEVSTLSVNSSMRMAHEDDWISYISMHKYIKAASGNKPAWAFAYAQSTNDAELVAAETLAARNNVYEVKQPEMAASVDPVYRTNLFGWIKSNQDYLMNAKPAARVALLYSPASRDYVDRASALGQYATVNSADPLWWESEPSGSAYTLQYTAEFRGMVKLLVHNHIPFEVVVRPSSAAELANYQTVIWPDAESVSDAEAQILKSYVSSGGHLIATGPNPGGWDEYGSSRPQYALSEVLGVNKGSTLPRSKMNPYGAGAAYFFADLLGKKYFTNTSDSLTATASLLAAVKATSAPWLTTNAHQKVHIELSQGDNKLFLQYVNFIGLTGTFSVVPTSALTTLKVPAGKEVVSVKLTTPGNGLAVLTPLDCSKTEQDVSFTVPVNAYALVVISLKDIKQ